MLIRLLVAVLTLVGPTPFRACTCAASVPAQTPGDMAPTTPVKVKKCRCAGCGPAATVGDTGPTQCQAASHSAPHERDCPAVNPHPVVGEPGVPSTPDVPTDEGTACAPTPVELPTPAVGPAFASERPHGPRVPLYITFRALRN